MWHLSGGFESFAETYGREKPVKNRSFLFIWSRLHAYGLGRG